MWVSSHHRARLATSRSIHALDCPAWPLPRDALDGERRLYFSEIVIPGALSSKVSGSKANTVTGFYADASRNFHGFVDQGGVVTTVDAPTSNPGLSQTNLNHLNAAGNVAVNYVDDNSVSQSAIYNVNTANWTLLPSVPGSMGSGANGVNINGTVVGSYTTADLSLFIGYHGFTYNG